MGGDSRPQETSTVIAHPQNMTTTLTILPATLIDSPVINLTKYHCSSWWSSCLD